MYYILQIILILMDILLQSMTVKVVPVVESVTMLALSQERLPFIKIGWKRKNHTSARKARSKVG
jgi:hypothetical protein